MFDVTGSIEMRVAHRDIPGGKTVRVHWPSDAQWTRLYSRLNYVEKPDPSGRGAVSDIEGNEEAEAEMFAAIMESQDPELDAAEISEVIDRLQWQRLRAVEREGDVVVVRLGVPGTETVHRLAIPTAAEKRAYRNSLPAVIDLGRGKTMRSLAITAPCKLYDAVARGAEGYQNGGAPAIHKNTAVNALLRVIEETTDDRDFF